MASSNNTRNLILSFDVGHRSIGWSVIRDQNPVDILGAGAVTFPADDCLASQRRTYRRMRRTIRSRRLRIERIKRYLESVNFLTKSQLDENPVAWPWLLAAMVLENQRTLSAQELWAVLRWYAHNRGYDGNSQWANDHEEDSQKEKIALDEMKKWGKETMAQTVCAYLGISVDGVQKASRKRFKQLGAVFPRRIVENEVRKILQTHVGLIPSVNDSLIEILMDNAFAIEMPELKLPNRYQGGLLFGQLIPRFDNRIIGECPFTGQKLPSKNSVEFLKYRWAMLVANILIQDPSGKSRLLTGDERQRLLETFEVAGKLTKTELKKSLTEITGNISTNLDSMLIHPDAEKALIYNPTAEEIGTLWDAMSLKLKNRISIQLMRGKKITFSQLLDQAQKIGESTEALEKKFKSINESSTIKKTKKQESDHSEKIFSIGKIKGRAPYSREILQKVFDEVLKGKAPRSEGGCIYRSKEVLEREQNKPLDQKTNNSLIRHRLLILERLTDDILKEYAQGDRSQVQSCVIEVASDLRDLSGKTNKEIDGELKQKLKSHGEAVKWLQEDEGIKSGNRKLTAGLIRKARVALDLGRRCPYTHQEISQADLIYGRMDLDHIIPRSLRPSDSLASLVITSKQVNLMKKNRTALQFIEDEQGKPVDGMSNIAIRPMNGPSGFLKFIDQLDTKGHLDDSRRKKNRKSLLLKKNHEEKEFLPKDLTQTSHLVRMGAQILEKKFKDLPNKPSVISIPGSVTAAVRKSWHLLGTLSKACPKVLDSDGKSKIKSEIRGLTHLHHALDAIVLGIASQAFPNNGRVWEFIVKRSLREEEKKELGEVRYVLTDSRNKIQITDLPETVKNQIRDRLAEKRVVQHLPKEKQGLPAELNTWGIEGMSEDGKVMLHMATRDAEGQKNPKKALEKPQKLIGYGANTENSKLKSIKGVRVIGENYGIALDPEPQIIPYFQVWKKIGEIKNKNNGKMPRILRNGMIIHSTSKSYPGYWVIRSIKDNKTGLAVDISKVGEVETEKENVLLKSITIGEFGIIQSNYCGISVLSEL
jgi:CRISPR-associated endonuclease Csn1